MLSSSSGLMDGMKDNKNVPTKSYATITQRTLFPTKDQAIIMDAIEGISLNDYILAIGNLVEPANVRFASKISMNRVCIYLASKQLVDNIIENKQFIKIGNKTVEIRPLLTKFKRLILSNVCPVIPHEILEEKIRSFNVRLGSSLSFLRAGISAPGFSHILSFRRQIYVHPEDINNIPPSVNITYDNTTYWIYLTTEKISCFICKQQGHLAKNCDENPNKSVDKDSEYEQNPHNETNTPEVIRHIDREFPILKTQETTSVTIMGKNKLPKDNIRNPESQTQTLEKITHKRPLSCSIQSNTVSPTPIEPNQDLTKQILNSNLQEKLPPQSPQVNTNESSVVIDEAYFNTSSNSPEKDTNVNACPLINQTLTASSPCVPQPTLSTPLNSTDIRMELNLPNASTRSKRPLSSVTSTINSPNNFSGSDFGLSDNSESSDIDDPKLKDTEKFKKINLPRFIKK